jgi:hypothetical protein
MIQISREDYRTLLMKCWKVIIPVEISYEVLKVHIIYDELSVALI